MRAIVVVLFIMMLAVNAQAKTKKPFDGFGPIKFGMTAEQAWDAVNGTGEWLQPYSDGSRRLIYRLKLKRAIPKVKELVVKQYFIDDRAASAFITLYENYTGITECETAAVFLVSHIASLYDVDPIYFSINSSTELMISIRDSYIFPFDRGAHIAVIYSKLDRSSDPYITDIRCILKIRYVQPYFEEDTPF